MLVPRFLTGIIARRTMRRGLRAATLKRERVVYGYLMRHDCSQHYGEGQWYSDGSLRFRCGLCGCTKRAMPPRNVRGILITVALWALVLGALAFLFYA